MIRLTAVLVLLFALGGCAGRYQGDESSPYYKVPAGSRLTLHEELIIPAEQVSVFIQGGQLVQSNAINTYYPHCKFEINTRRDFARSVRPDQFIVTRTVQEQSQSVDADTLRLARVGVGVGIGVSIGGGSVGDGGITITTYATRMYLNSAAQPDVRVLSCGHRGQLPDLQHVTIDDIQSTLGSLFTLQLPAAEESACSRLSCFER